MALIDSVIRENSNLVDFMQHGFLIEEIEEEEPEEQEEPEAINVTFKAEEIEEPEYTAVQLDEMKRTFYLPVSEVRLRQTDITIDGNGLDISEFDQSEPIAFNDCGGGEELEEDEDDDNYDGGEFFIEAQIKTPNYMEQLKRVLNKETKDTILLQLEFDTVGSKKRIAKSYQRGSQLVPYLDITEIQNVDTVVTQSKVKGLTFFYN